MRIIFSWYGYFTMLVAICYYFYNDHMFRYINLLTNKKLTVFKSRILTFIINYIVFILISQLQFYLIINWTIFAAFLVFEIAMLYRCSFKMSLFCGIQGALIGLAINFITRSGAALLLSQPLAAFDSRINSSLVNLKPYPIGLGFLLAGIAFWWMHRRFHDWADNEENPDKPANLTFSLCLAAALFFYLDLNLLIYFVFSNETIIKLWGMKSGFCVLIGYYLGTSHTYTLTKLQKFERQSYLVRKELKVCQMRNQELEQIAYSDSLTGCCTRELGRQAMQKAFAKEEPFYVCFIDLNNLKPVNDHLGHDAGDRYLSAVTYALVNAAEKGKDIVCRYGGDEFLLIVPEDGLNGLQSRVRNAQWALNELSHTSEYPFKLWISYGIACSLECKNLDELIELADKRMYENKRRDKQAEASSTSK